MLATKKVKQADVVVTEIPDVEGELNDFFADLGGNIARVLTHTWEDCGIGSYEYWGAKGNDVNWQPILTETVTVFFPTDCPVIPIKVTGHYEGGGCPGEDAPRHRCGHQCQDVDIDFEAVLITVKPVHQGFEAEYAIQ
jgi:hypothetical protein